jgi:uncharacterized membrane protein YkvI
MGNIGKSLQVGFTYIGTIVGAGFATGQEILQFFTRYGWMATLTIALASLLFIWLGTKLMLLANELGAKSYEDLNVYLFGPKAGVWVSFMTMIILFGITTVMLAGAGSIFSEHLNLSYQLGLIFTLILSYIVIVKGIHGILAVNSIVVPIMFIFTAIIVMVTVYSPNAANWVHLSTDYSTEKIWLAPFLYVAFNLALAQAVLVPVGAAIDNRKVLKYGGVVGGIGIGLMLFAGHFVLSANMPGIAQFEIPMGNVVRGLGRGVQLLFLLMIFAEIFTTFIADAYGLALQIRQRTRMSEKTIIIGILLLSYLVSQIGFKTLLSTLYPLFGMVSMAWFVMMVWRKRTL